MELCILYALCDNIEDYIEKTTGLFPMEETPEQFVKRYFGIK